MSPTNASITSVLNALIETCENGKEGFRSAAESVKNPDFKSLFSELAIQRQGYAAELQRVASTLTEDVQTSGTVVGAVHRAWLDLKAAVTSGDEHAVLEECERGEDHAVSEYRDALQHEQLPANIRDIVQQQFMGIQAAHDRVRDLRDRFAE